MKNADPGPDETEIKTIVQTMQHVAVLGAHEKPQRPAHYVPLALHEGGVTIHPVNVRFAGQTLFDSAVVGTLAALTTPIDVVDVFRRSDVLETHREDILAMSPLPKVVWLQEGIVNDDFAGALRAKGITVVQDRCLMVEFRRHR